LLSHLLFGFLAKASEDGVAHFTPEFDGLAMPLLCKYRLRLAPG